MYYISTCEYVWMNERTNEWVCLFVCFLFIVIWHAACHMLILKVKCPLCFVLCFVFHFTLVIGRFYVTTLCVVLLMYILFVFVCGVSARCVFYCWRGVFVYIYIYIYNTHFVNCWLVIDKSCGMLMHVQTNDQNKGK